MSCSTLAAKTAIAPTSSSLRRISSRTRATSSSSSSRSAVVSVRADATNKKVVVLGGSGFVGSRVVERLAAAGVQVTSVSRSGAAVAGAATAAAIDLGDEDDAKVDALLKAAMAGADAVVSCVGTIGSDDDAMRVGNGVNNVRAIKAAKAAGVKRFVYVSVASIVPEVVGATPLMKGYFAGKVMAEEALRENFEEQNILVVKPSFVYGGDTFSLTPPRVSKTYGDILVKLLGAGFVKSIAKSTPGPIRLTLAEPVSVDDVAGACVAGAMGTNVSSTCDGTDEIKACAALLLVA